MKLPETSEWQDGQDLTVNDNYTLYMDQGILLVILESEEFDMYKKTAKLVLYTIHFQFLV